MIYETATPHFADLAAQFQILLLYELEEEVQNKRACNPRFWRSFRYFLKAERLARYGLFSMNNNNSVLAYRFFSEAYNLNSDIPIVRFLGHKLFKYFQQDKSNCCEILLQTQRAPL